MKGATLMNYQNRIFRWSYKDLTSHRKKKLKNAIERRDNDYLLERQEKFSRVFPMTLGAVAKFTFREPIQEEPNDQ
jgi:hypothetical protein